MRLVKKVLAVAAVLLALLPAAPSSANSGRDDAAESRGGHAGSLFGQSVAALLDRNFPNRDVSYLLLDVRSGEVLAARWRDADRPVPLGSLVKPFVALSYAEATQAKFPQRICRGQAQGCWRPGGHGSLGIEDAVAHSCNAYFLWLAGQVTVAQVETTARQYGIAAPPPDSSPAALIGIGSSWRIAPLQMARAYAAMLSDPSRSGMSQLISGMARSARAGTGKGVGRSSTRGGALVKTGTARCSHQNKAAGDGYVIAAFPADSPRMLLMLGVHGTTGSNAAGIAGAMLRAIQDQTSAAD